MKEQMDAASKPSWMRRHKGKLDQISLETESVGTANGTRN